MVEWIIHLKDGRTLTDRDAYPHEIPTEDISSVERVVGRNTYTICNNPPFSNFFVKTTAEVSRSMQGGKKVSRSILERIIGCYVNGKTGPVRIELVVDPKTGNCKLMAKEVKVMTKDGF